MFDEEYEKLNSGERESFRKTVTSLLCHTFILSHDYDPVTGERFFNAQYGFALRNYELLEDYLGYRIVAKNPLACRWDESNRFRM